MGALAHDTLRPVRIGPQVLILGEAVQLAKTLLRGIPVKDASESERGTTRSRQQVAHSQRS